MIERAIAAGVSFAWVAADTVYGVGEIEMALRRAGKGYVLGVTGAHQVLSWDALPAVAGSAAEGAKALPAAAWRRLSAGEGTKGPRLHDWAYLELAHLEADEDVPGASGLWTRGLLIRRHIADGELAYFTTWCPAGTPIATLVAVEGTAGLSRTLSRPRRPNSASTTTRPGRGTAGIVTSRWSCWPSPWWRSSATGRTRHRPKKR